VNLTICRTDVVLLLSRVVLLVASRALQWLITGCFFVQKLPIAVYLVTVADIGTGITAGYETFQKEDTNY